MAEEHYTHITVCQKRCVKRKKRMKDINLKVEQNYTKRMRVKTAMTFPQMLLF